MVRHSDRHTQLRIIVVFALILVVLAAVAVGIALLKAPPESSRRARRPAVRGTSARAEPGWDRHHRLARAGPGRTLRREHRRRGRQRDRDPATANAAPAFS